MRRHTSLFTTVVAIAIVVGLVALVTTQHPGDSSPARSPGGQSGPTSANVPQYGQISATLTSPETNVTFHIVEIERSASLWFFHIHAHNSQHQSAMIIGRDHYFVLTGAGTPGTPVTASQNFLTLVTPAQAGLAQSDLATHPALAATVQSGSDADGWLVANIAHFKYTPYSILYVYGTVTTPACTNPQDKSTCHPATGYRALVWMLA